MVAVDSTCHSDKMLVRPSMEKFKTANFPEVSASKLVLLLVGALPLVIFKVGVCGFSSPYSFGHLNRQLIYLLSGLKVKHFCY